MLSPKILLKLSKFSENVIVPSLSFIAAANVVKYCNGNLIFVDNADDLNIDLNKLEKFFFKLTSMYVSILINWTFFENLFQNLALEG